MPSSSNQFNNFNESHEFNNFNQFNKKTTTMPWLLIFGFAVVAFVYASVGFGGGSSYIALLALAGLPFQEIRLTALICNVIVVTGGVWIYAQNGQLNWRKILPLAAASVPLAFLGGKLRISQDQFFLLLGWSLVVAALLLWFQPKPAADTDSAPPQPVRDGLLGGGIGLLSGMVGIGGGIFLAPLLHLLRWDSARKIAATASVFILVNSISGIAGQLSNLPQNIDWQRIALLSGTVLVAGQIGSRVSIRHFNLLLVRRLTALLVLVAGLEVLLKK